jgi:hypothetical protein
MSIQVSDIKVCCWRPGLEICLPGKVILSLFPPNARVSNSLYFFDSDAGQPGLIGPNMRSNGMIKEVQIK